MFTGLRPVVQLHGPDQGDEMLRTCSAQDAHIEFQDLCALTAPAKAPIKMTVVEEQRRFVVMLLARAGLSFAPALLRLWSCLDAVLCCAHPD